jgi:CRP/FNR family transcriptional regulator, cyclic AMP receptor protein
MSDPLKYAKYAEKVAIFHGLTPEEVEGVIKLGKILIYQAGKTIFHEGMLGQNLFIVLKGEIGIYLKQEKIAACKLGDAFGEMAVLNKRPRNATALAETDCRLFTLSEMEINQILEKRVAVRLLMNIIHILSERLEHANAENARLRR